MSDDQKTIPSQKNFSQKPLRKKTVLEKTTSYLKLPILSILSNQVSYRYWFEENQLDQ